VISTDSLTVVVMVAALAFATRALYRKAAAVEPQPGRLPPRCLLAAAVAVAGVTGLFAALWLDEFASTTAAALVALVSLAVLVVGLLAIATTWLWSWPPVLVSAPREASTPRARRRRPRRARDRR
jgi:hypothetical protein